MERLLYGQIPDCFRVYVPKTHADTDLIGTIYNFDVYARDLRLLQMSFDEASHEPEFDAADDGPEVDILRGPLLQISS